MSEIDTGTKSVVNYEDITHGQKILAVTVIERAYLAYRDRQMFVLLKHAVRAAESSWTYSLLRKICPLEADLLKDPCMKARVRFRFAGQEFPPIILFKIYMSGDQTNYMSGKRVIQPATSAATDACKLMGHRKFYDQMIVDACQYERNKVLDEIDICTLQDYMQYLSNLDETPSYLGGKENFWRELTLEVMPRQSIMYDIVEYLQTKTPSMRLRNEMSTLLSRPITEEVQLRQYTALSRLQTPQMQGDIQPLYITRRSVSPTSSRRRSSRARKRAAQMRKNYVERIDVGEELGIFTRSSIVNQTAGDLYQDIHQRYGGEISADVENIDQEAKELFEWTKDLNVNDISRGVIMDSSAK